jgi:hypothetical protein
LACTYEVEGKQYVVADGVITEIMDAVAPEEPKQVDVEALSKFMTDVLTWMAEKDAQIEGLVSKVNGSDETANEQFKAISEGVEKLQILSKLIPADLDKNGKNEKVAPTFATALQHIKEQSKRN